MSDVIDLGGAPANEDCAQLGHTPDFERLNRLEVDSYRAALIARFGLPPEGCALVPITNRHDFGIYRTLGLKCAGSARFTATAAAYVAGVQNGLASWIEAGFTPPVRYDDGRAPTVDRARIADIVMGAILATRPGPSGLFTIPEFETLHRNLVAAYPVSAEAARAILEETTS